MFHTLEKIWSDFDGVYAGLPVAKRLHNNKLDLECHGKEGTCTSRQGSGNVAIRNKNTPKTMMGQN